VVDRFVDVGVISYHYCFNFLFIITYDYGEGIAAMNKSVNLSAIYGHDTLHLNEMMIMLALRYSITLGIMYFLV
jgi:hypothetical protein